MLRFLCLNAANFILIAGDAFLTYQVYLYQYKEWVNRLLVPYLAFFGLASVVSAFTIGQKVLMIAARIRSRHLIAAAAPAVATLDGVAVSSDVGQLESVRELKEKFDENRSETKQLYLVLLLGLCEGASMLQFVPARPTAKACGQICQ